MELLADGHTLAVAGQSGSMIRLGNCNRCELNFNGLVFSPREFKVDANGTLSLDATYAGPPNPTTFAYIC
jgi:hypothetical protein